MITRQDIIDMANEAQLADSIWIDEPDCVTIDELTKFSELVAAKERSYWKDIIEGQRNCIKALNSIVGGEGSTTTSNIISYSRLEERMKEQRERYEDTIRGMLYLFQEWKEDHMSHNRFVNDMERIKQHFIEQK